MSYRKRGWKKSWGNTGDKLSDLNFANGQFLVQIGKMLNLLSLTQALNWFQISPSSIPSHQTQIGRKDTAEAYVKWNNKYYIATVGNKAILPLSYECTVPCIL